ncbi:hypothetical protein [Spongiactinospora gelatinilytica]|uniref:hypothetical protein n=1 Tax=Spongiactinospora gelatinilytica TaxID=2666298 RepID=UPI0011B94804|nr:hypothetical protein [Spongiactinospora gelatinilytica]
MTIDDLIEQTEREKIAAQRRVSDAEAKAERILTRVKHENRDLLTLDEERKVDDLVAEKRAASDLVKELSGKLTGLRQFKQEEEEITRLQEQTYPTGVHLTGSTRVARIGLEERTYKPPQADRDGRVGDRPVVPARPVHGPGPARPRRDRTPRPPRPRSRDR